MADSESMSKSSYYVWLLGFRESKGLRGAEFIRPVVRHLLNRRPVEDSIKVTLQVSGSGIKMVQAPEGSLSVLSRPDLRQFVPHSSITCVHQSDAPNDDVVACIVLSSSNSAVSNDCPLYVHAYRCDSAETAELLREQLQALVDRPENRAKFDEIERRLVERGLITSGRRSQMGSDGRSLGRSSDSGSGSDLNPVGNPAHPEKLVSLYDSLAAELREKLTGRTAPLLLPPRDYDTMHRSKGNLTAVETRRALNPAIVGGSNNGNNGNVTSGGGGSDGSSGIGSDETPHTNSNNEKSSLEDDWPTQTSPAKRPLVPIQTYMESSHATKVTSSSAVIRPKPAITAAPVETAKDSVDRKSSFQEIQKKFRSLERKQHEIVETPEVITRPSGNAAANVGKLASPVHEKFHQKLEKVLRRERSDLNLNAHRGAGNGLSSGLSSGLMPQREAAWTRSTRDLDVAEDDFAQNQHQNQSRRLENYLSRQSRNVENDFEAPVVEERPKARVTRQASRCSSGGNNNNNINNNRGVANMEAVGEFERVWSWEDMQPQDRAAVPLTRELSPEYGNDSNRRFRALSPVERRSRGRSPERTRAAPTSAVPTRGVSASAAANATSATSAAARRRALSPEVIVRRNNSTRATAGQSQPQAGMMLRRERTTFFDSRYPSLDARNNDKRSSMYEMARDLDENNNGCGGGGRDPRRRSYHELAGEPSFVMARNFPHSGKRGGASEQNRAREHFMVSAMPPWVALDPRGQPHFTHPPQTHAMPHHMMAAPHPHHVYPVPVAAAARHMGHAGPMARYGHMRPF